MKGIKYSPCLSDVNRAKEQLRESFSLQENFSFSWYMKKEQQS